MHIFGIREQTLSFDVVFSVVAECDHPRADVVFCRFFSVVAECDHPRADVVFWCRFFRRSWVRYTHAMHCTAAKTCAAKHSRYGRLLSTCVHVDMACMRILQQGKKFFTQSFCHHASVRDMWTWPAVKSLMCSTLHSLRNCTLKHVRSSTTLCTLMHVRKCTHTHIISTKRCKTVICFQTVLDSGPLFKFFYQQSSLYRVCIMSTSVLH